MLNKDLKLNEKLFEADVEKKATREGYGAALEKLGQTNPNVVVLSADLTESTKSDGFAAKYPKRFFECGVAEQNMAAVAAGLASSGKIAYISSYATFSPGKNWETIRTTAVYNWLNVKIAGHHAGIMTGPDGATHQATEDIAITRVWPKMTVFVPCDAYEAERATIKSAAIEGPVYLRFTRDKTPLITTPQTPFDGKAQTFWVTKNPQAVIFVMGYMTYYTLLAAKELKKQGINILVANVASVKPLDIEGILELARQTGAVVSVEDHQIEGGLGSAIAELLAKRNPTPQEFVGLQNTFAESGKTEELLFKYNMGQDAIVEAVKKVISRKSANSQDKNEVVNSAAAHALEVPEEMHLTVITPDKNLNPLQARPIVSGHTIGLIENSLDNTNGNPAPVTSCNKPLDKNLIENLKQIIKGDVAVDAETLAAYSHDASLFEVKPQVVVFPKDEDDVKTLVKFVADHKGEYPELSLTGRSAGTDMSGGSINESIIVAFGKYMNNFKGINGNIATAEPGMFYRDFEKETLKKDLIFPSYPASRQLCAMGGIFNNNSGGEKSLKYGKTEKYVRRERVILRDGNVYDLKPLNEEELVQKMAQTDLEGEIYSKMYKLITDNYDVIQKAKPQVSKNSAGYFLWNVYNREKGIFDLTQLWTGAQGTLGLLIEGDLELVPVNKHRDMLIIFLHDMNNLGEIIREVLKLAPESFESYDDNTLMLALKYFPEFAKQLGIVGMAQAGFAFLPAFLDMFTGRKLPKLVLQIDFTGNDLNEVKQKVAQLKERLKPLHPQTQVAEENAEQKYWLVRRESFNLLRKKIRDKHTAPFIDDFVIKPEYIAEVIPQVTDILKQYPEFIYTVAGHVGNGNFHIIPLVDITNPQVRTAIPEISKQVYNIVAKYHGSITGEHNDGLIRTPFLEQMYGHEIVKLFEETKKIFDPDNIFNPGKKVNGSLEYAMNHIRNNW